MSWRQKRTSELDGVRGDERWLRITVKSMTSKKEHELVIQWAEMIIIKWMCGVKITDRFTCSELRETRNRFI